MTAPGQFTEGPSDDPTMIDFVEWLTTRTEHGRAHWNAQPGLLSAVLPGSFRAQFVTYQTAQGEAWLLFTILDSRGDELLRATPTMATAASQASSAAQALFVAAIKAIAEKPPDH